MYDIDPEAPRREIRPPVVTGKLIMGLVAILLGVLFTLSNFGVIRLRFRDVFDFWPLIFLVIGVPRLWSGSPSQRSSGLVFVIIGGVFMLRNFGPLDFSIRQIIPLILILIGVRAVMGALGHRKTHTPESVSLSYVNDWVAFGGLDRVVTSDDFRGGDVSAFCGGFKLNLRKAQMQQPIANIDVFAWWGGGELLVPREWNVVVKTLPIMGGVDDKTEHPVSVDGAPVPQLVISGTLVMGGLEIKN